MLKIFAKIPHAIHSSASGNGSINDKFGRILDYATSQTQEK
ncbi:MAG: hypothetical protein ABI760_06880 [Ferruginibacter sp.]